MTNPKIETDLAQILLEIKSDIKSLDSKIEQRFEKIEQRFDKVDERLNKIEIGQADLKGEIKSLDTKTEQLEKRIGNIEFANRGILVGLVVVILGGAVKLFGSGN
jgi:chromosome segregation ATPase